MDHYHPLLHPNPNPITTNKDNKMNDKTNNTYDQNSYYNDIITTLPRSKGWMSNHLFNYQGVWLTIAGIKGVISVQQRFEAFPSDILLATLPKSGTTWLKALVFSILNRKKFDFSSHPLLEYGPHDCVTFLESAMSQKNVYREYSGSSCDRVFATHIPYESLSESVKASGCKIVYLFRDPKDVLVSSWYYMKRLRPQELSPLSLEEAFEMFIQGISNFGPFWDHVLSYRNASLHSHKNNIIFLSYEDLKLDPITHLKRLAQFLGFPFSIEEEGRGVIEEIIKFCDFENLSNLEVNKVGVQQFTSKFFVENNSFFRKGEVGDWKNHLTDEMVRRIDQTMEMKFIDTKFGFSMNEILSTSK